MSSEEGYCLVRRESALGEDVWYVVPAPRRREWYRWVAEASPRDSEPEWAELIDSAGMVEQLRFPSYWVLE